MNRFKATILLLILTALLISITVESKEGVSTSTSGASWNNELPMYGGSKEPFSEKNAPNYDKAKFAKLSHAAAALGWRCLFEKHDISTAMKRFNQAWMNDPENYEVYWGFGIIQGIKAENSANPKELMIQTMDFLVKASNLAPDNVKLKLDLANSYTGLAMVPPEDAARKTEFLAKGETICKDVLSAGGSQTGRANFLLAANFFYQEKYKRSKEKADASVKNGFAVPQKFLDDLTEKLK